VAQLRRLDATEAAVSRAALRRALVALGLLSVR
jgi:hypothetical protein